MKHLLSVLCLVAAVMTETTPARGAEAESKAPGVERIVVPKEGTTAFAVTGRSTLFRLPISVMAGGTIGTPKITGSVKLLRTAEIVTVNERGQPSIGAINMEFVFRGTAAGTAVIEVTKTLPVQPAPVIERYTVTIK